MIKMNIFEKFRMIHNIYVKNFFFIKKKTYSMNGEDVFIDNYFKKNTGFYVDVGAYHPLELNNTYLLYKRGWNGVNIDINSLSIDYFNYARPDDTNINIAAADKKSIKTIYYQKKKSPLNTLNSKLASKHFSGNFKKKKIKSDKLTSIIDKTKFKGIKINFLNIDAEGNDFQVLKSLNFKKYKPKLICVEMVDSFNSSKKMIKKNKIYKFLIKKKYKLVWSGHFSHIFAGRE
ncbi:FkbM family methyltransferase [Pelagibacteraceae bacterium]|nr:FkbM family methyltransferase [Pelagibacteraceae bacterium]